MSFKSNKSKLDFKVHYNFVYMSIFVCVYIYTPFFVVFFFFTIGSGCSSKKVDYFSYNFNSSSALRLLHISTMLKNNRETHRYHKHPTIRILKNGGVLAWQLPPSAPTPCFQVAVIISAKHSEQWKMCMTSNYCSMSIQTEDEPEIKFVWSQSALIYR